MSSFGVSLLRRRIEKEALQLLVSAPFYQPLPLRGQKVSQTLTWVKEVLQNVFRFCGDVPIPGVK